MVAHKKKGGMKGCEYLFQKERVVGSEAYADD
jgi:hypothetical protein